MGGDKGEEGKDKNVLRITYCRVVADCKMEAPILFCLGPLETPEAPRPASTEALDQLALGGPLLSFPRTELKFQPRTTPFPAGSYKHRLGSESSVSLVKGNVGK